MTGFIYNNTCNYLDNCNDIYTESFISVPSECKVVNGSFDGLGYVVIDSDGYLWVYGSNWQASRGLNFDVDLKTLTKIPLDIKFAKVSCGASFTAAIDIKGNIWYTGAINSDLISPQGFIQLTEGTVFTSIASGSTGVIALDTNKNLWGCGHSFIFGDSNILSNLTLIKENTNFLSINAGSHHSLAIDINGNVWGCGSNQSGQLAIKDQKFITEFTQIAMNQVIKSVALGWLHTLLLGTDGSAFGYGSTKNGELGFVRRENVLGESVNILEGIKFEQISCTDDKTMLKDEEGNVWIMGRYMSNKIPPRKLHGFKADTLLNQ